MALATHGTAWLGDPRGPAPRLERSNSTFQYVRSVSFVSSGSMVGDVAAWLEALQRDGVTRLWLVITPPGARRVSGFAVEPHVLMAFAGAGTWFMLATGRRSSEWRAGWEVGEREAPDQRIWDVTYKGSARRRAVVPDQPSLA